MRFGLSRGGVGGGELILSDWDGAWSFHVDGIFRLLNQRLQNLYHNLTYMYPQSNIWIIGTSDEFFCSSLDPNVWL